jgi:Flp pilus assembly protein TadD
VLAVVTGFAFRGMWSNGFLLYDDNYYVTENNQVQQGITFRSIEWALTTFDESNWHPLTWISHMVDWSLYGNHPPGQHMTNLCLHVANAILLYLLLLYMSGYAGRSAMVAFLFALHPAHVESVAWLAERKDLLCAFFWFATLLAYAWYVRRPSWKRFGWVVCGCACSLLSKPMAVTLPFTLLLLDIWPLRRIIYIRETRARWLSDFWKLCAEKWLLFVIAAISCIITYIAQHASGAVTVLPLPMWQRLCTAAISYWRYVRIMFWPNPLTIYYYYDVKNIKVYAAVISAIAIALVTAACWYLRKSRPYCLVGWLWFLGTLVPVIGIVQVGKQAMAERYTYVPLVGLFIAVVWLIGDAVAHSPRIGVATQLLAVAVLAACAVKTDAQVQIWKDTISLFSHAIEVDPRGELAYLNLGVAYGKEGRLAEAQGNFERALQFDPTEPLIPSDSAFCIMRIAMQNHDRRDLPLAGQRLEMALHVSPDNLNVLSDMALWSMMMGKPKDEETYSRKVLAVHPDFVTARMYLAESLRAQGKLDESAQEYRLVIAYEPSNFNGHEALGVVLFQVGDLEKAVVQFRYAVRIDPASAEARRNLALALDRIRNEEAEQAGK